jgi:polyisoprenyl-phosphate glycosyltransferase
VNPADQTTAARELDTLSIVAPVLNEEQIIETFYERICTVLEGLPFELVLVDDGSSDGTPEVLDRLAGDDPRVRVLYLSRNFGYQAAVTAGLDHARGNAVVTIDSDLQDPPELIPELLRRWREGSDVVYAFREERPGESWAKLATSRWFARLFARLARVDLPHNVGDYRLLDRRALDALLAMREHARFLRGMAVWVGYTQTTVPYRRDPRHTGDTRYSWGALLRISLDALTSFSRAPLQLAMVLGFAVSAFAFVAIPLVIIGRLAGVYIVEGISSVLLAVLLLGGIQLITIGIIGEYVSRVYEEVKQRPLYLVRGARNVQPRTPGAVDQADADRALR